MESCYFCRVQLIDTHIHLYAEEYEGKQSELIALAQLAGIQQFLLPNIDSSSLDGLHRLVQNYPDICIPMMGLHPCYVKEDFDIELEKVRSLLADGIYKAIGEIGLDKYWDLKYLPQQEEALRIQLQLAESYNLPVALHTRNATRETIELIKALSLTKPKGVFHCFGGTLEEAREITEMGYYLGIGGVLTFKNSGLDAIIKEIPLEYLVLETDGPYLAPAPHRGKRNDPAMLRLIAEKLAEVKGTSLEEVAALTSANARKLFGI